MGKGKDKVDGDNCTRERTILWDEDQTKFMLGWYMDFIKDQHAGFKVKKQHHFKCAESLNRQFNMGVTATQVERHFRHYKENWKFIATALNKSGNTFDTTRSMVIISESEKEKLKDRARRLLSKPIKFFNEMQELFLDSSADGSLAMDATTCLNESQPVDDNDNDDDICNDVSNYGQPEDDLGDDSDTLPSPKIPSQVIDQSSSSSGIKRPRGDAIPVKRDVRPRSRMAKIGDEINTTLMDLRNELKQPPPPPIIPSLNSDAELWQRLEKMTLTTDQKLIVGTFLASKDQKGMRGFLSASAETTFQSWVFKFLSDSTLL
ncbi:uncharacterized protein [Zea mays]|nr:uncharacterized protein LOC103643308 [Zea mays]|eukprot:XP_008664682.1 uncharacterized protein LOC103643308 [Zea mays]